MVTKKKKLLIDTMLRVMDDVVMGYEITESVETDADLDTRTKEVYSEITDRDDLSDQMYDDMKLLLIEISEFLESKKDD